MKVMYDNRKPGRKLRESDDSLTTRYYNRDGLKPWRGCRSIKFKYNGTQSDPDLIYKNYVFNYWDIEDALWNDFLEYNGITEKDVYDGNNIRPDIEEQFDQFVCDEAPSYLDDYIANGAPKNWHSKYEGYGNRDRVNKPRLREDVDEREIGRAIKNTKLLLMDYLNERGNSASVFARSGIEKAIDALGGLMLLFPTKINESVESTSSILSKMKNIMGWWDPSDEDREYVSNVYDPSKYVDRSKDTYCGIPAYGNMNWMIREKWIPTTYITSDEWEDGDGAYHETYEPVFLSLEAAVSPDKYKRKRPYRYLGHSGDEYWPATTSEKDIWEGKLSKIITKYID